MEIIALEKYNIFVGNANEALTNIDTTPYSQIILLCDENTERHCLPLLTSFLAKKATTIIIVSAGEQHKNLLTCEKIWQQLLDYQVDRKALLINVGGGVIGDMGGFCASTFKRGFDFIQVPTTLLSLVDASVGGKLGIDFNGFKNTIGVFQDPKAVIIDVRFLKTLPYKELRSGYAEVIKHTLIADKKDWQRHSQIKDIHLLDWKTIVYNSLVVKKNIVEQDPFEKNIRKALNFGHTVGHAVESYFLDTATPLLHGEAIAIGMIVETFFSYQKGFLTLSEKKQIVDYLLKIYGKISFKSDIFDVLIKNMQQDKKNEHKEINFTALEKIGTFKINQTVSEKEIVEGLIFYQSL
jgi:3-dehydroquinate synthase